MELIKVKLTVVVYNKSSIKEPVLLVSQETVKLRPRASETRYHREVDKGKLTAVTSFEKRFEHKLFVGMANAQFFLRLR